MLRERSIKNSKKKAVGDDGGEQNTNPAWKDEFHAVFGFRLDELYSISSLLRLLNKPMDPASLGVLRIMFGFLMFLDTLQERGFAGADVIYNDPYECYFPLFNFLRPLPVNWMIIMYTAMAAGCLGILFGFLYRLSCLMFVIPYWYIFFLDKTSWNNHSYLFGLVGFLLLITDGNRYWSLDGLIWPRKRNAHVPLWNYTLLRSQFFIVYFLAGLKKLDLDWMTGYSMQKLSLHWVFMPFQLIMSNDQIDLFIVHIGGLILDLTIGFLIFFDVTRPFAFFFGGSFHLMNSQIFSIGMFPWTMLATMPLFCYTDWPRVLLNKCPFNLWPFSHHDDHIQSSSHCVYKKDQIKTDQPGKCSQSGGQIRDKPGVYHKTMAVFCGVYLATQLFLPYSHCLTKGYNNWTNGLYGYSWDMMVHSWSLQHITITYVNKDTGDVGYLKPFTWTRGKSRWSSHSDMVKQYATCIQERLKMYNISNVELYFDVWRSMNKRFQQRMFDPRVDIVAADWSVFSDTPWILPLMVDLSSWREELRNISSTFRNTSTATDVVFVADFPGLHLENFIQKHMNTTVKVLKGEVVVELESVEQNFSLAQGEKMELPADQFHKVHTVSDEPSCYMYVYVNSTYLEYVKNLSRFEEELIKLAPKDKDGKPLLSRILESRSGDKPEVLEYKDSLRKKNIRLSIEQRSVWWSFLDFWAKKYNVFRRSFQVIRAGFISTFTNETVGDVMFRLEKDPSEEISSAGQTMPTKSNPTDKKDDNVQTVTTNPTTDPNNDDNRKASSDSQEPSTINPSQ